MILMCHKLLDFIFRFAGKHISKYIIEKLDQRKEELFMSAGKNKAEENTSLFSRTSVRVG